MWEGIEVDPMQEIKEHAANLNEINLQIAELVQYKEQLERHLIEKLGRARFHHIDGKIEITDVTHEGMQSHSIGKFKLEIKTDVNFSVKASEYEAYRNQIRKEFNPITIKETYHVNKRILNDMEVYGSDSDKVMIGKFIQRKYAKPHVSIKANV